MEEHFVVPQALLDKVTSDKSSPDGSQVEDILAQALCTDEPLTPKQINTLVNATGAANFPEIRDQVLEVSTAVRKLIYGGHVVVMAPIEVGNRCASDCNFCGWRSTNSEMIRSNVPDELVLLQADYLIKRGILTIELVAGDDIRMVREVFPRLIPKIRKLFPPKVQGRIQICTTALTTPQYEMMREAGADGIIVWQEAYDPAVYRQHITRGPKANGIDDDWKVQEGGDGYTFRLQSQDRAFEAGLEIALGTMIGLNPDLNYELLATILHARHLIERGVSETHPLIVGMPTWNRITTPNTDKRPPEYKDPTDMYSYIAALYFLSLDKRKAWIFPNCRVPMDTQVEALKAGGVFTSTEVKLGPAGYMPQVLEQAISAKDKKRKNYLTRLMEQHLGRKFSSLTHLRKLLDQREQFVHYFGTNKDYKRAFHRAGLNVADESTLLAADDILQRLRELYERYFSRIVGDNIQQFLESKRNSK